MNLRQLRTNFRQLRTNLRQLGINLILFTKNLRQSQNYIFQSIADELCQNIIGQGMIKIIFSINCAKTLSFLIKIEMGQMMILEQYKGPKIFFGVRWENLL